MNAVPRVCVQAVMSRAGEPWWWTADVWERPSVRAAVRVLSVFGVLMLVVIYVWALWKLPDRMHLTNQRDRHNARLLVVSFGGGVFVAITLLYTARNYQLSHRGQVTDRFTKALERLASDHSDSRLGAVYALRHVARDSRAHRTEVLDVLEAFARRNQTGGAAPDVQAALATLLQPAATRRLTLTDANLTKANLTDANLTKANLTDAKLTDANLTDANLARAKLARANLARAKLTFADLAGADLAGANLTDADLASANLAGANLTDADLASANLTGANLTDAKLTSANLTRANLTRANLTNADLTNADLTNANLTDANLTDANLLNAKLTGANLLNAKLTDANLTDANLFRAKLTGADLRGVLGTWEESVREDAETVEGARFGAARP
jgi:uncharacterized protein YjbI with pentapeptide repeats